ncbi:MAG: TRAP transporter small permease [Burkholderiaceae bacterium]
MSFYRTLTALYARLLNFLLCVAVGVLIIPVTLQIVSRYTALIPSYIWTEEMARFLFVWMVMIGAMIGIRDSSHFVVDVWPRLSVRANAALHIVAGVFVLAFACVFLWGGYLFTRFAANRISELAELPLWMIHMAWPLAGITWILFQGEHLVNATRALVTGIDPDAQVAPKLESAV